MDITHFIASHREALLIGDYDAYREQLSRQLLALRKRLGRATPKREKFAPKPVTAEDVAGNPEFGHLHLLTAERAWAHAMRIKTSRPDDTAGRGITGDARAHLLSRLHKAARTAEALVALLQDRDVATATEQDVLEARAYAASMAGAEEFERRAGGEKASAEEWKRCLTLWAEARVIYAALAEREGKEVYRDILANTVDPTIRYAAYQAHVARTVAMSTVAKKYFPTQDEALVKMVEGVDPYALKDRPAAKVEDGQPAPSHEAPSTVEWRGRKANIVDAAIGQALANVAVAETRLRTHLSSAPTAASRDKAAAYDDVLTASQDAADATKRATDELERERVDEGDARMQDLRVTSLKTNYDLISRRVGRNRVLIGEDDGLRFSAQPPRKPKRKRKDGSEYPERAEPRGRKLARLRERVVLYDAIIQSINSVKGLRGAMRDATFVAELDRQTSYFRALKCLNIAHSHSLLGEHVNALALLKRAHDLAAQTNASSNARAVETDSPLTLAISSSSTSTMREHIDALLTRTHALVVLRNLEQQNAAAAAAKSGVYAPPLVHNLRSHPPPGVHVDLTNLVTYPPRLEPVPVSPIFLDVAWNYIDYPGRTPPADLQPQGSDAVVNGVEETTGADQQQQKRKGWFGFGR